MALINETLTINGVLYGTMEKLEQALSKIKFYSDDQILSLDLSRKFFPEFRSIFTDEDGFLHRGEDLPAIICSGSSYWYKHGYKHRDGDRPAEESSSYVGGYNRYFKDGKLHREFGPAVISYGHAVLNSYFINGFRVEEWELRNLKIKKLGI